MKQSTKLLSLVLALVMAFSCMAVIGNAALVKSEVTWDNIDDAQLTAEQVADLALDMVDNDLLAGMETIDLSILGSLRLNKIDYIIEDICTLRDSVAWTFGSWLLGDLAEMDFSPFLQSGSFGLLSSHTAYQRSHGDINVIMALLEFIGNDNNSNILSKAAYGLNGGSGISLGLIGVLLNLGEVGDMLLKDIFALFPNFYCAFLTNTTVKCFNITLNFLTHSSYNLYFPLIYLKFFLIFCVFCKTQKTMV